MPPPSTPMAVDTAPSHTTTHTLSTHPILILYQTSKALYPDHDGGFLRARVAIAGIAPYCYTIHIVAGLVHDHPQSRSVRTVNVDFRTDWQLHVNELHREVKWGVCTTPLADWYCLRLDTRVDLWRFAEAFDGVANRVQDIQQSIVAGMSGVHRHLLTSSWLNGLDPGRSSMELQAAADAAYIAKPDVQATAANLVNESDLVPFSFVDLLPLGLVPPLVLSHDGFSNRPLLHSAHPVVIHVFAVSEPRLEVDSN
ncbi:hypothetical protein BC835DRAFT_1421548 [Cytidiella melzeri]|nr:hypothetical protein BC835DRAFT_1421548 [Cytidiella melzeri]